MKIKTKLNLQCLRHPSTISKIDGAMREAIRCSNCTTNGIGYAWVANKKGATLMHVQYKRKANGTTELRFLDWRMQDVTSVVRSALEASLKIS